MLQGDVRRVRGDAKLLRGGTFPQRSKGDSRQPMGQAVVLEDLVELAGALQIGKGFG